MFGFRKKNYKFSHKVHSKKGIFSTIALSINVILLLFSFYQSAVYKGNGPLFLGSIGIFVLFFSLASMIVAAKGLREADVDHIVPFAGMIGNGILFLISFVLYVVGLF